MPSTVEKLGPSRVKLTIEIPFAELKPHLDKAYREIASQVTIPGFRKGKVPQAIIDQRFGRGSVLQEAINEALPGAYNKAVAESQVVPLAQPDIDITKLEDGEVVEFTAELDVRPDFELPDFSELTASVPPLADLDDEVEQRLTIMRQRFATRTDVDRPAAEGDVVTLDLEASRDGEPLEDATASGISYKLGEGGMLEGLDDAVTGLAAGESAEFTSELVGGPNAGENADIRVTVVRVQDETLPEVDDEFASMVSEFDTVDEMRADLAEGVTRVLRVEQLNAARDAVVADLVAKTDFELPEAFVAAEVERRTEQITEQLSRAGYTLDRYLEDNADETASTAEEFWEQVADNARTSLKAQLILDKLAEDRALSVEQAELTQLLFSRAQANGTSPEQEMQHMLEHDHTAEWMGEVRRGKALDLILGEATVTDTDGNVVDVHIASAADDDDLADLDEELDDLDEDSDGEDPDEENLEGGELDADELLGEPDPEQAVTPQPDIEELVGEDAGTAEPPAPAAEDEDAEDDASAPERS